MTVATAKPRIQSEPIVGPSVWGASSFSSEEELRIPTPPDVVRELLDAIARNGNRPFLEVTANTFHLPRTAAMMARVRDELWDGRGFVITTGLPVEGLSVEQMELCYWLLGLQMGKPVSQSAAGERIAHVKDRTKPGQQQAARGYTSRRELPLHTDQGDYMGLYCVNAAKSGGLSLASSVHAVFNTILERRPDLLEPLFRGFPYHRKNEQPDDQPAITPFDVPVLGYVDDRLAGRYVRASMNVAYDAMGKEWAPKDREALDMFDDVSWDDEHLIKFQLRRGEIYWANNWLTLHSRTEFEDHEEPEKKRLYLRMWLQRENPRSRVPAEMCNWRNPSGDLGIDAKPGGKPADAEFLRTFKQRTL